MLFYAMQSASSSSGLSAAELLALLRSDISMEDVPQSGVVDDEMLAKLLDRTWMLTQEEKQQQQQQQSASDAAGPATKGRGGKGRGKRSTKAAAATSEPAAANNAESASGREVQTGLPYPAQGVGYEVVQAMQDSGLLSQVN